MKKARVKVTLAVQEDVMKIAEITHAHEPHTLEGYVDSFTRQVETNYAAGSKAKLFVAKIDNEIVAHGKIIFYSPDRMKVDFESPVGWYLNGVVVDPCFRRIGVASELTRAREAFILEQSENHDLFSIVSAENIPSIGYHKSLGFEEFKRAPGFLSIRLSCGEGILFKKSL